jgi:hypothetical protein
MNNRFKFRVWDKLENRMIYPHNNNQQHFIIDLNGQFHNLQNGSGGDDYVVQLYIGIIDKNKNEVCDGDVIRANNRKETVVGFVKYDLDYGAYRLIISDILSYTFYQLSNLEVIGNIFENNKK